MAINDCDELHLRFVSDRPQDNTYNETNVLSLPTIEPKLTDQMKKDGLRDSNSRRN